MSELAVETVLAALETEWLGRPYHFHPSVGSTNDVLKKMAAQAHIPAGTMVLTDFQSEGRGRLTRRWEAPPATSLLFSLLFRPDWPAAQMQWLTMMAGVAVLEAIEAQTGLQGALKWPNDVLVAQAGTWRKVCGVLVEADLRSDGRLQSGIVGIGVNVNIPAAALPEAATPATSLLAASGAPVSRPALLVELLRRLEGMYETAVHQGASPQPDWNERLLTIGQSVQVTGHEQRPFTGVAEGTNEWGHLLVRDEAGTVHEVAAGDVTLRLDPQQ